MNKCWIIFSIFVSSQMLAGCISLLTCQPTAAVRWAPDYTSVGIARMFEALAGVAGVMLGVRRRLGRPSTAPRQQKKGSMDPMDPNGHQKLNFPCDDERPVSCRHGEKVSDFVQPHSLPLSVRSTALLVVSDKIARQAILSTLYLPACRTIIFGTLRTDPS